MPETSRQRRLAAILAADIAGYTSAMGRDEDGTLRQVRSIFADILLPEIKAAGGRVFKEMGDGLLAEFASAVSAADAAMAIQDRLSADANPMSLRIGLHLGDVIAEGDDLFGDGVNIAARLQAEAEPGQTVASDTFRRSAEGRNGLHFDDLGERKLRNVAEPVHLFALYKGQGPATKRPASRRHFFPLAAATLAAVILGGFWYASGMPGLGRIYGIVENAALLQPAVAVIPFESLAVDQEFFAEGLAEDLIADLAKVQNIKVISRTSSFAIQRPVTIAAIAKQLGVTYVVDGSVRRAGDDLRITASLIDTGSDNPVWSERFDGKAGDVFAFQDEITAKIMDALKVTLSPDEKEAVTAVETKNPDAYDAYLRGLTLLAPRKLFDVEANQKAQQEFGKAIDIDPKFAQAYAGLAWAKWLYIETINYYSGRDEPFEIAERSLAIRETALAHRVLARRYFSVFSEATIERDRGLALMELEKAHQLQPGDPDVMADLAQILPFVGRTDEALVLMRRAVELNPGHPDWYYVSRGIAYLLSGRPELAVPDLDKWVEATPSIHVPYIFQASAYGLLGDEEKAKAAANRFHRMLGTPLNIRFIERYWPMEPKEREFFMKGLEAAGVDVGTTQ